MFSGKSNICRRLEKKEEYNSSKYLQQNLLTINVDVKTNLCTGKLLTYNEVTMKIYGPNN